MLSSPVVISRWRAAALIFSAWTLVGCVAVAGGVAAALSTGRPLPSTFFFFSNILGMWLWALYTPLIFTLCERYPLDGPAWRRGVGAHAALFLVLWSLEFAFGSVLDLFVEHPQRPVLHYFFSALIYCLFCYLGALAVGHALRFHRLYLERAVRASELESQLLRSQLLALQMQLRPHFLFNALHTVSGLVRTDDKEGALRVVAGLADLLRAVLRGDANQQVPLRQEVELVERYLGIEQLRFQERLHTELQVDPEVLEALVPQLLLQPLVENAVRHGTCVQEGEGRVFVHIRREAEMLCLSVEDSGAGSAPGGAHDAPGWPEGAESGGIGLANTRARLRHLYGERHRLSLRRTEDGGTVAEVAIPFLRAERAS
ncbi:sensor histidine kinase [Pyxidicoccus sp. MSG2]|uniref:sensor histidine kinase n=1 Tax=Pyxidicoccus sp. MSG2 TaxID=2996790 RepID=UPI00226D60F5|nr:histidine kinase [Pyxidicoccus sp. MSG2]MCY1023873.1 histidine kinase [Pyxidicoccus sp. MSG2]